MRDTLQIRNSVSADNKAIESLYPEAFPDEDLLPVVRDLLQDPVVTTSIVGVHDDQVVAHIIFTACGVSGSPVNAALLAPLGVTPEWQRQGIGSELVRAGLQQMESAGMQIICVLGDPAYYGRFGFRPDMSIRPPYPLPKEYVGAWQSIRLSDDAESCSGQLLVPAQWRQRSLWMP